MDFCPELILKYILWMQLAQSRETQKTKTQTHPDPKRIQTPVKSENQDLTSKRVFHLMATNGKRVEGSLRWKNVGEEDSRKRKSIKERRVQTHSVLLWSVVNKKNTFEDWNSTKMIQFDEIHPSSHKKVRVFMQRNKINQQPYLLNLFFYSVSLLQQSWS